MHAWLPLPSSQWIRSGTKAYRPPRAWVQACAPRRCVALAGDPALADDQCGEAPEVRAAQLLLACARPVARLRARGKLQKVS